MMAVTDDATINALVAEHVLGWERVDIRGAWVRDGDDGERPIHARWRNPDALLEESHRLHEHPPDVCNDGDAMLHVIEAMRSRGARSVILICNPFVTGVEWQASINMTDGDWRQAAEASDALLPRAVALAALKALKIEVSA